MKLFNCKVRLGGDARDEVRKAEVTSAEIGLLKLMHGDDAVLEVIEDGNSDRSDLAERARLEAIYGERAVLKAFGAPKLTIGDEDEAPAEPKRTARRSRETVDATAAIAATNSAPADTVNALD